MGCEVEFDVNGVTRKWCKQRAAVAGVYYRTCRRGETACGA